MEIAFEGPDRRHMRVAVPKDGLITYGGLKHYMYEQHGYPEDLIVIRTQDGAIPRDDSVLQLVAASGGDTTTTSCPGLLVEVNLRGGMRLFRGLNMGASCGTPCAGVSCRVCSIQ